jgi:hypothetical protein
MMLKAGTRLKSAVDETEVIVVLAPSGDVDLRCGGVAMIDFDADRPEGGVPAEGHRSGTLLGKRYAQDGGGIEVLCTKPGEGSLSIGDLPLPLKEAKPLPASD